MMVTGPELDVQAAKAAIDEALRGGKPAEALERAEELESYLEGSIEGLKADIKRQEEE